nr:hypothetical protein StreXyl84_77420 [Streptomyces sp. Xyl84]
MTPSTPPTPPPVTLIIDVDDDTRVLQAARASSDPQAGRVTVDLTPHTPRTAYLPRDILRALGRTDYQSTASEPITAAPAWRAAPAGSLSWASATSSSCAPTTSPRPAPATSPSYARTPAST